MAGRKPKDNADVKADTGPVDEQPADDGPESIRGPSPDPKTNLLLADIALRGGGMLVRQGLERGLLGRKYAPEKTQRILKGRGFGEALIGTALAKLATRSVPGAILVGGGLIAKTLYDRRHRNRAKREGEAELERLAEKGKAEDEGSQEA